MNGKKVASNFALKLIDDLTDSSSRPAQMVKDLKEFYYQMGGNAAQQFESRLREFTQGPDAHLGFIDEVNLADVLRYRGIPHYFIPETRHPTPDIRAEILSKQIYFEVKAVQEDRYMSFIDEVLEQVGVLPSQRQLVMIPVYIGQVDRTSLVAGVVQEIQNKVATSDFSPIQYDDEDASIYIRFEVGAHSSWRFTWAESRVICDVPFLNYKLEKTLRKNIGQFKSHRPTFLVWYTWDQSLWDSETQASFLNSITNLLGQHDFGDVAGIIVAAPGWFVVENELYRDHSDLKSTGLFDAIRALK